MLCGAVVSRHTKVGGVSGQKVHQQEVPEVPSFCECV